jgi:hypothetical protein
MLSYKNVIDNVRAFRTFTGFDKQEFEKLLVPFQHAWNVYIENTHMKGKKRQRKYGGGRKATLATIEDKLFFILCYLKIYPLQEVLAFLFDMSQGQANTWLHKLSHILKMALEDTQHVPTRSPEKVKELLEACLSVECIIDGTERRRQRPHDPEQQQKYYSGTKKAHTYKNNLLIDLHERKIHYLSQTYEGKKHDKAICDEEPLLFPRGSILFKDTGFQGYEPAGIQTCQPKKKPRGRELTAEEKASNTMISSVRIVVEHVLAGVKRCRIVKDVFRNTKALFDDLVMEIACGLHNVRVAYRYAKP